MSSRLRIRLFIVVALCYQAKANGRDRVELAAV